MFFFKKIKNSDLFYFGDKRSKSAKKWKNFEILSRWRNTKSTNLLLIQITKKCLFRDEKCNFLLNWPKKNFWVKIFSNFFTSEKFCAFFRSTQKERIRFERKSSSWKTLNKKKISTKIEKNPGKSDLMKRTKYASRKRKQKNVFRICRHFLENYFAKKSFCDPSLSVPKQKKNLGFVFFYSSIFFLNVGWTNSVANCC